MAISSRGEMGVGGGSRGGSGGGSKITLGSPESRARLAVARNKATLAEKQRAAKNTSIKKIVTKKKAK